MTDTNVCFSRTKTRSGNDYIFIDSVDQLKEKSGHTVVISMLNGKITDFYKDNTNNALLFLQGDCEKRGISLKDYVEISNYMKRRGWVLNKKTCTLKNNKKQNLIKKIISSFKKILN